MGTKERDIAKFVTHQVLMASIKCFLTGFIEIIKYKVSMKITCSNQPILGEESCSFKITLILFFKKGKNFDNTMKKILLCILGRSIEYTHQKARILFGLYGCEKSKLSRFFLWHFLSRFSRNVTSHFVITGTLCNT